MAAALTGQDRVPLIELRDVETPLLEPVLAEESEAWRSELDWDFGHSADLVRRFVGMRALTGFVLPGRGEAAGYTYYVLDEGKGLIGGLYIRRKYRTIRDENTLIAAALEAMWRSPGTQRVEAQLVMLSSPLARPVPYPRWFRPYERLFLEAPLAGLGELAGRPVPVHIEPWREAFHEDAARLIAAGYAGHIDSRINDQYCSTWGARRFLSNIVQYPGCGTFFSPGSLIAREEGKGAVVGLSLASLVAPRVGHITQLCLAPSHRGIGLGYELLRRSLQALAAQGCYKASLTVTASNDAALRLYRRFGFRSRREFAAYVWQQ